MIRFFCFTCKKVWIDEGGKTVIAIQVFYAGKAAQIPDEACHGTRKADRW